MRSARLLTSLLAALVVCAVVAPAAALAGPPPAPTLTSPADHSCTAIAAPRVDFTGLPGTISTLYVNNVAQTPQVSTDGAGDGHFTPTLTDDSTASLTVTQTVGGTESAPSNSATVRVHTSPPVVTSPADHAWVGTATPDVHITSALPGCSVALYIDGSPTIAAVDNSGNAVVHLEPLTQGSHAITPLNGAEFGPHSWGTGTTLNVIAAPLITSPADHARIGPHGAKVSVDYSGAASGSTVTLVIDGIPDHAVPAGPGGAGTIQTSAVPVDGAYAYQLVESDGLGHDSDPSATVHVTIDNTAPVKPTITSPANASYVRTNRPTFSVTTTEPGAQVKLWADGVNVGTATADSIGVASVQPTVPLALSEGGHAIYVTAIDSVGNISVPSSPMGITVDSVAPSAPVLQSPTPGSEIGDVDFTFSAEPFSHVTVLVDGATAGSQDVDGSGVVVVHVSCACPDGPHAVTATTTDLAGNVGAASAPATYTFDTTPPTLPVVTSPTDLQQLTSAAVVMTVHTDPGARVVMNLDGTADFDQPADGSGNVSFDLGTLADGGHFADVVAIDAADNASANVTRSFFVDASVPAAPVIVSPVDGSWTENRTPTIEMTTAEPYVGIYVSVDDVVYGAVTSSADDTASFTLYPEEELADGPHTITAVAQDSSGHTSAVSAPVTLNVGVAPDPPVDGPPADAPASDPVISHTPNIAAVKLSKVALHGRTLSTCASGARHCAEKTAKLSFTVNQAARIRLTLKRTLHGTSTTAATATVKATKAGAGSYVLHRRIGARTLPAGSYQLVVTATSTATGAAPSSPVTLSLSVR